jgi:phosphoribosyl 1,2-cyclic phosphodiesterase
MVHLTVLGSGSSGNCAVVSTGETTLLLDAGLSAKQICARLETVGLSAEQLDGILLTHEHQDHTRGLEVFCKTRSIPLLCTALTRETLVKDIPFRCAPAWKVMQTGCRFEFRDLKIECFPVPHDAVDPVGYLIADADARLGFLSDVGHITNLIRDRLAGVNSLFVEANYDAKLLDADTKRPWAIKQRISSRHGHLSNQQTAELIDELAHPALHHIVLGHLSDDCNDPALAVRHMREVLDRKGFTQTQVQCAGRREVTPTLECARRHQEPVRFGIAEAEAPRQMALF